MVRKIDADAMGVYHQDNTQLLKLDKGTANTTILSGLAVADRDLWLYSNSVDTAASQCTIKLHGGSDMQFNVPTTKSYDFWINAASKMAAFKDNSLFLGETTTPTAQVNFGAIYTKNDNKLYFQDGAGVEHEVTIS